MFKKMPVCRLMISCPSDVKTEIEIIKSVVENINDSIGMAMDVFVKTLHWKRNVMPEAGDCPQNLINKQILDKADVIIAIFGNKMGSPTQKYDSGTIEEIEQAIKDGKQVFVYFSDKPVRKSEINAEEEKKIQAFKDKYKDRGIYVVYSSDAEFNENVSLNLTRYLVAEFSKEANSIDEKTRFDDAISQNHSVDLIYDYTRFYEIKSVVYHADPTIMQLSTHKDCFDMAVDISNVGEMGCQEFVMALLEYTPCDNWSVFFQAGYFLEFDAMGSGGIRAFQLEVKDDIHNKVIDRMIEVSNKGEHVQIWLPSITRDHTSWKRISQVCFTVFFNSSYIDGKMGTLNIRNLKMMPK